MGVFGLVRGIVKIGQGVIEGDVAKIAKGAVRTAIGAVTIVTGNDDDDDDDSILDDDD